MSFFDQHYLGIGESKFLICSYGLATSIDFNEIAQIRILEVRNLFTNYMFIILLVSLYYYFSFYYRFNFNHHFIIDSLFACLFYVSYGAKSYHNVLFIITTNFSLYRVSVHPHDVTDVITFCNGFYDNNKWNIQTKLKFLICLYFCSWNDCLNFFNKFLNEREVGFFLLFATSKCYFMCN
jgi:hypothetical protein